MVVFRSDVHVLRALSLVLVLLFHAEVPSFRGGFIGVDIFFFISGFLITKAIDKPSVLTFEEIKEFYARRIRRIAPALIATILVVLPFAWKLMYPVQLSMFSQSIVATSLNVSNIYFLLTEGYFGPGPKLNPFLHTWSIGVEMQFYFVFPLLFWPIKNLGLKTRITAITTLAILSLAASEILTKQFGSLFGFFMMPTRLWQFLFGSFIYIISINRSKVRNSKLLRLIPFVGITVIYTSAVYFNESTHSFGLAGLIPLSGAALVLITSHQSELFIRFSNSWIVQWVGNISYATYLVHWPIFSFFRIGTHSNLTAVSSTLLLLFSMLFGSLLYIFVDRFSPKVFCRKGIVAYSVAVLVVSSLGVWGYKMNGFDGRNPKHLPKGFLAALTPEKSVGNNYKKCSSNTSSICEIGNYTNPSQQRFLLIGDSHSSDLSGPFQRYIHSTNSFGQQMSVGGCNYLTQWEYFDPNNCSKSASKLNEILISESEINLIYVSDLIGYSDKLDTQEFRQLQSSMLEFIKNVSPRVKSLIVVSPRPHVSESVSQLAVNPKTDWGKLGFEFDSIQIGYEWSQFLVRQSELLHFRLVEQFPGIYSNKKKSNFLFDIEGLPIFRDQSHLSKVGSELVFSNIKRILNEQSD